MFHARTATWLMAAWGLVSVSMSGCGFGGPLIADTNDGGQDTSTSTDSETGADYRCGPPTGVVSRVIDGDTVELESGERVRYILVDTTETTNGKNECFGAEATEYNKMLVLGRTINIEYDVECRDKFERLLGYVTVDELDGIEVNRALLVGGFACVFHIPPNGDARFTEYQALANTAKSEGIGMWGACADVPCEW